jgi:methyl-accepting chemotaxis protein
LRSKEAATRTEELIMQSVQLAERGGDISKSVSVNLDEIVDSVGKVNDLVVEIATASEEQARGIRQVNQAINQMDAVVQQSAANSEESSSAAEELSSQAMELTSMVGRFQLNREPVRSQLSSPVVARPHPGIPSASPTKHGRIDLQPNMIIPLDDDPELADF